MKHQAGFSLIMLAALILLICSSPVRSATIYVNTAEGSDYLDGSSWDQAKQTVGAAVVIAESGDEIWAAAGTYVENIILTDGVSLYGGFAGTETTRDERDRQTNITVLDGGALDSTVKATENITSATVIDGFTITNGSAVDGGGILCNDSSPTITHNVITTNTASAHGAGIYCLNSSPIIAYNTISTNTMPSTGTVGGGICLRASSPIVKSNLILENTAAWGAGISFDASCSAVIANNTIVANSGGSCGGIYCASGTTAVKNNIVAFCSSGIYVSGSASGVDYNCVYSNVSYNYSSFAGGSHDVRSDPEFVSDGEDYHILPTSPCANKGVDSVVDQADRDIDGLARITSSHADIGADELSKKSIDFNGDHYSDILGVNLSGNTTYSHDAVNWMTMGNSTPTTAAGDFDGDGYDDIAGLSSGYLLFTLDKHSWDYAFPTNQPTSLAIGDFNADGKDDAVVIGVDKTVQYTTDLENGWSSTWTVIPGYLSALAVGDLDGDRKDDIIGLSSLGTIRKTTDMATWVNVSGKLSQIYTADVNGDGKADIVGISSSGQIWRYLSPSGPWAKLPGLLSKMTIGDFNGDGKDDIAGISSSGRVYYCTNVANGTSATWIPISGRLTLITAGDYDRNGKDDILGRGYDGMLWRTLNKLTWKRIPVTLGSIAR